MNLKALLTLLLSAFFILGGSWLYNKYHAAHWCGDEAAGPPLIEEKAKDPLMFKWNNSSAFTHTKFPGFQANILAGNEEGKILEITGKYFDGELSPDPGKYTDMGMARADGIWKTHFSEIPATRIKISSEKVEEREGIRTNEFSSAAFNWIDAPKEERKVIELPNQTLVYFNYNNANKKANQQVDDYLKKLSERLQLTTEKVVITGHTDSDGSDASNQSLGMQRARSIRNILRKYGVPNDRITILSKGESEPEESNSTARGKASNRRAVVQIVN